MANNSKSGNPSVRAGALPPVGKPVNVIKPTNSAAIKKRQPSQIGLFGAVAIGLASMLGAGLFVVFHNAYVVSPGGFFWALGLAALVAALNSWTIYSLARKVDRPGGVYAYAREYLNPTASFLSGFAFVFGKIGSIAAIALAFSVYLSPSAGFFPAALAIVAMTLVNIAGIHRTALMAAVLAIAVGGYLLVLTINGFVNPSFNALTRPDFTQGLTPQGILGAAAVFFFAFAGYARVATLGNEVKNPKRNIPTAIVISLSIVVLLYFALALVLIKFEGPSLAMLKAPISTLASLVTPGSTTLATWVTPIAVMACLGSMLALLAGVSRTSAVMAEDSELPKFFAVRNKRGVPYRAELVIAAGAIVLTAVGNLTYVIGFSSFSVLFYYAVGHLTTLRQPANERVMPKWVAWVGFALCALLAVAIPGPAVPVSAAFLLLAVLVRIDVLNKRAGKRRFGRGSGAAMSVVNELFQPSAANAAVILEEKREARKAMPAPEDKLKPGSDIYKTD